MTITLTREEAQQVLDALDEYYITTDEGKQLIETLRARLAQPEPDRGKLFGVIHLDKDAPLTPEDRKQLRLGLMACLLEDGVLAKLGMLLNRYERTIEHLEAQLELEPDKYLMEIECTKCGAKQDSILTVNAPPQRKEWQGLTDEERKEVIGSLTIRVTGHLQGTASTADYAKAIEAKLREKNGG